MFDLSTKARNDQERQVLEEITREHKLWYLQANLMRVLHITLGLLAVVCSLLVAARINSFPSVWIGWLAFTAALSVGLQSAFDLGGRINHLRKAWWMLKAALMRYHADPEFTINDLIKSYEQGQELSGDVKEEFR